MKSLLLNESERVLTNPGRKIALPKLFLHSTLNTLVCCRVCRGKKIVTVEHTDGLVRLHNCIACHGTGRMKNG
jgi:hypothetical protein